MSNHISPESEQFIQYELESGTYRSRDQLLDEAVRLLKRRRELQREIQAGIDSGASISGSEVFRRLEEKAQSVEERAQSLEERARRLRHRFAMLQTPASGFSDKAD